ncbi:hypothetical protein GCM10023148_13880 [Actinokineospora soli]
MHAGRDGEADAAGLRGERGADGQGQQGGAGGGGLVGGAVVDEREGQFVDEGGLDGGEVQFGAVGLAQEGQALVGGLGGGLRVAVAPVVRGGVRADLGALEPAVRGGQRLVGGEEPVCFGERVLDVVPAGEVRQARGQLGERSGGDERRQVRGARSGDGRAQDLRARERVAEGSRARGQGGAERHRLVYPTGADGGPERGHTRVDRLSGPTERGQPHGEEGVGAGHGGSRGRGVERCARGGRRLGVGVRREAGEGRRRQPVDLGLRGAAARSRLEDRGPGIRAVGAGLRGWQGGGVGVGAVEEGSGGELDGQFGGGPAQADGGGHEGRAVRRGGVRPGRHDARPSSPG